MNPFKDFTPAQVEAHNRRVAGQFGKLAKRLYADRKIFNADGTFSDAFKSSICEVKGAHETHHPRTEIPNPKPQRDKAPALVVAVSGEEKGFPRTRVCFTGYRVRPLDPDNFAGSVKDLLDGLRHAQLVPGDEPWQIILTTDQVKVASFKEEKTVIDIIIP